MKKTNQLQMETMKSSHQKELVSLKQSHEKQIKSQSKSGSSNADKMKSLIKMEFEQRLKKQEDKIKAMNEQNLKTI